MSVFKDVSIIIWQTICIPFLHMIFQMALYFVLVFILIWIFYFPGTFKQVSFLFLRNKKHIGASEINELLSYLYLLEENDLAFKKEFQNIASGKIRYKFFTKLIEVLENHRRTLGVPLNKSVVSIRLGLLKDYQFERKIRSEFFGSITQLVIISILTWVLVFAFKSINNSFLIKGVFFKLFFLQSFGGITYYLFLHYLRHHYFNHFDKYFAALYQFYLLSQVGIPFSNAMKLSKIECFIKNDHSNIKFLRMRLKVLIKKWQIEGLKIHGSILEVIDEVWFLLEQKFAHFLKMTSIFRLVVLVLFFLPGYFFVMISFSNFIFQ